MYCINENVINIGKKFISILVKLLNKLSNYKLVSYYAQTYFTSPEAEGSLKFGCLKPVGAT